MEYGKFDWNIGDLEIKSRCDDEITVKEKLNIGDVVKLKSTKQLVTIAETNCYGADYGGYMEGENGMLLFNQYRIQEIILRNAEKMNKKTL